MADDWQVGDLAVEVNSDPDCPACGTIPDEQWPLNGAVCAVQEVDCMDCDSGAVITVLSFFYPPNFWCSCGFRKITPDAHTPCEAEFVTLIKRAPVNAPVPA